MSGLRSPRLIQELPLTPGQEAMWMLQQLFPDSGIYTTHFAWELPARFDVSAFRTLLEKTTARHPAFRTLYALDPSGKPCQRIYDFWPVSIEECIDGDNDLHAWLDQQLHRPFRLHEAPPTRWMVYRRPNRPDVLAFFNHHICIDLWSVTVLFNDLVRVLDDPDAASRPVCRADGTPALAYADFIEEQNRYLASENGKRHAQFWSDTLQDMPGFTELPVSQPRPPLRTCNKKLHTFPVSDEELARFQARYLDHNRDVSPFAISPFAISPFVLYEALFHALIHRYSGQDDVAIGVPTAGREDKFGGIFGYFSNSIILRARMEAEETFGQFLVRHAGNVRQALAARDYPFSLLTELINETRDPSRAPLVQICLVWENINRFENRDQPLVLLDDAGHEVWQMGSLGQWRRIARVQQSDDFDLTLKIHKYQDKLQFAFEYNAALFNDTAIANLARHFRVLMQQVARAPDRPLRAHCLLTQTEYHTVVTRWNQTRLPSEPRDTLLARIANMARENPHKIAVEFENTTLTYEILERHSDHCARQLVNMRIEPEDLVGVYMERTPDVIVCLLAILKAGAAYLPLDPDYPRERLRYILDDARPTLIIKHDASHVDAAMTQGIPVALWPALLQEPSATNINLPTLEPHQLAYVIYTSGSTGKPKGAMIEHRNLHNFMLSLPSTHVSSDDRVLQMASINFDASILEMVAALASGATLVMARKTDVLGPSLLTLLRQRRISYALIPPALLAHLDPVELPDLTTLLVGGDACSAALARKWSKHRRLINAYGPTEATIWATLAEVDGSITPPIGKPIVNTQTYILDAALCPVPVGLPGELYIGGDSLARGYLHRPDLSAEKFVPNPFDAQGLTRLYRTGDRVRHLPDGNIEFLGRLDHQVKIRGYRIEPGEIESVLRSSPAVTDALVLVREDLPGLKGEKTLVAYVVKHPNANTDTAELRAHLRSELPDYMLPSAFVWLDSFPRTPNEKIDRKALPLPQGDTPTRDVQSPRNEIERILANTWKNCLGLNDVSITENFFDLGGHSLLLARVHAKLPGFLQEKLSMVDLYKYPTIQALAHFLESDIEEDQIFVKEDEHVVRMLLRRRLMENISGVKIAIVGMAGRFPGADTLEDFWQNICDKKEGIRFFTPEELRAAGVPDEVIRQPNYVPAKGMLNDVAGFDAAFFNFTPREASITDPQQRLFLECAWQALEDAGCVPSRFRGRIGVYGGVGINQYLAHNLSTHPELLASLGDYAVMLGNDKDFLCTRVSYKLNLNGPAMVVQTACSTSLVAVHTACQALLSEECDAALAGGVSLSRHGQQGYFYHEGMIMSPDGHCRAFDANAAGTVQGQGCGVVLLKRLDDAMRDNDHIYAVISGSATNNDGSNKTGYTAPSVEGQAKAIQMAHASANLSPARISYVEAHGTGTPIGDPIEFEALRMAFRDDRHNSEGKLPTNSCAIGSVKTNIGHLDAAAGVTGLIKTALALRYRKLPPSLHFQTPNPKINFQQSPFYVNTELRDWNTGVDKRFAGVSSFGMGGTNAHVILTEPPSETLADRSRPWRLVTLSARTPAALERMTERFVGHLEKHPQQDFANVCYTLHLGRTLFEHRRFLVCKSREEAIADLSPVNSQRVITTRASERARKLVFLFSGQGSQYIDMGLGLYKHEPLFRSIIDDCRNRVANKFIHVYEELSDADINGRSAKINDTYITQPALFIFEYALAKTLMSWGITPDYMLGHSVGEYVAACLSGVFTLDQALELVAIRGQLIQQLEVGDMLSVRLSEAEASLLTNHDVSLAAVNGEQRCVLSGAPKAIQYLHEQLNKRGVDNRILHTSHAFHSHMMEPVLERFSEYVRRRQPQAPTQRFISSLTGDWITAEQATSPQYWADHLRHTVRYHQGLSTVFAERAQLDPQQTLIFLEVGPGQVLTTLTRQHSGKQPQDWVLATTRHAYDEISDSHHLLKVLGRLWEQGIDIQWDVFHSERQRYRVPLPTYPFERSEHWIKPATATASTTASTIASTTASTTATTASTGTGSQEDVESPAITALAADNDRALPRDDIEETLWKAWATYLGHMDFGIFDNFFDLGGDSMLAVRLLEHLRQRIMAPLSTPVLIQHPTVAELADYVQRHGVQRHGVQRHDSANHNGAPHDGPLVMIQRGSARRYPLLMVHPIGGEVFFYRDLARQLGNEQPLYAFQAPSLSGTEAPVTSVYALAERYIDAMKKGGFKPPYFLGGSSFGGLVAYEMAQQLKRYGEDVRLVTMIDTPAPNEMPRHLTDSAAILQYLMQDKLNLSLEKLRSLPEDVQIDYVLEEARVQSKGNALPPHLGQPLFRTWIAHQEATYNYTPAPYADDVVFFQHTEPTAHFPPEPGKHWENLVEGAYSVHPVPGNHISMNYPPHVKTLASHLKTVLRAYAGYAR